MVLLATEPENTERRYGIQCGLLAAYTVDSEWFATCKEEWLGRLWFGKDAAVGSGLVAGQSGFISDWTTV